MKVVLPSNIWGRIKFIWQILSSMGETLYYLNLHLLTKLQNRASLFFLLFFPLAFISLFHLDLVWHKQMALISYKIR